MALTDLNSPPACLKARRCCRQSHAEILSLLGTVPNKHPSPVINMAVSNGDCHIIAMLIILIPSIMIAKGFKSQFKNANITSNSRFDPNKVQKNFQLEHVGGWPPPSQMASPQQALLGCCLAAPAQR